MPVFKSLSLPIGLLLLLCVFLSGCVTTPPKATSSTFSKKSNSYSKHIESPLVNNVHSDLCKIFTQKPTWYQGALKSQKKWKIPVHVMMSIMKQESAFQAKARPPRRKKTNLFGKKIRQSSAYGYAQAQNQTWRDYQKYTKQFSHRRDVFNHAIDFIGWYGSQARRTLKLKSYDTYNIYLSYHEGLTGFRLKTYQKKPWLIKVATKVKNYAYRYHKQLKNCNIRLKNDLPMANPIVVDSEKTKQNIVAVVKKKDSQKKYGLYKKDKDTYAIKPSSEGCYKVFGIWPFCAPFQN